jgi:hypothetical protein
MVLQFQVLVWWFRGFSLLLCVDGGPATQSVVAVASSVFSKRRIRPNWPS